MHCTCHSFPCELISQNRNPFVPRSCFLDISNIVIIDPTSRNCTNVVPNCSQLPQILDHLRNVWRRIEATIALIEADGDQIDTKTGPSGLERHSDLLLVENAIFLEGVFNVDSKTLIK